MGKSKYRSDESDEDRASVRKHKKKSKNRSGRSRSRSGSDSGNSHVSSSRSKKSKKRHGRSSMSQSPERHGRSSRRSRRSRSRSYDRHYSSSRRGRRSQSRSVSPSKRGRHSRSPYHSRSRSPSTRKSRRSRSASRSRGQRRRSRSYSGSRSHSRRSSPETRGDASTDTKSRKGHSELKSVSSLTPAQQAEERMRLALKAAVAADQKLRQLPLAEPGGGEGPSAVEGGQPKFSSYEESQSFADSVAAIDSGNFRQALFKSSRSGKPQESPGHDLVPSHDDAIFGSLAVTGFTIKPDPDTRPLQLDPDSIMHQSLFCNAEDKLDQWIQRLAQLRRRKLEGDAL